MAIRIQADIAAINAWPAIVCNGVRAGYRAIAGRSFTDLTLPLLPDLALGEVDVLGHLDTARADPGTLEVILACPNPVGVIQDAEPILAVDDHAIGATHSVGAAFSEGQSAVKKVPDMGQGIEHPV